MKPWKTLQQHQTYRDDYISLRTDKCQRADGHIIPTYHILEQPEWVTIIPMTSSGNLVLIEEYRHGAEAVTLGLPGGVTNVGETDMAAAAARELREETGYSCGQLVLVGRAYANWAWQNNQVSYYLGLDAAPAGQQQLDPNEEIRVVEMAYSDFLNYDRLAHQHSLHAAALFYAERYFQTTPYHRPKT